jgi:hypothetical protein
MKNLTRSLLALLLTALPAFAQFEGVLEMKMTMADKDGGSAGGGNIKVAVGKPGARSEMTMQMPQMSMTMVMLFKNDSPDTVYRINDAGKNYTEINLAKMRQMAGQVQDNERYDVKKLGEEKILGYKTQHVLVKHGDSTTEMWNAKDFLDYDTYNRLQARQGGRMGGEGMAKALKDAGVDGMPLKSIMTSPDGSKVTMEVVKADKQSLPASTFEIPAGYAKSSGGLMDMMGGISSPQGDDMKKRMEDAMKNLTPEQRARIEQMMKQRAGGSQ